MKLLARAIVISFASVALVGCGGGGKPSEDALVKFVMANEDGYANLTKDGTAAIKSKTAKCVAQTLRDSEISSEALTAIVEEDVEYQYSADDTEAIKSAGNKIRKDCKES